MTSDETGPGLRRAGPGLEAPGLLPSRSDARPERPEQRGRPAPSTREGAGSATHPGRAWGRSGPAERACGDLGVADDLAPWEAVERVQTFGEMEMSH